ncbi:MAG: heme exporter protein CcmB, partial [Pseudomonadota bacterium]
EDVADGSLDQLRLTGLPLELIVLAKTIAHWLLTGLPLAVASPLIALLFGLPTGLMGVLVVSLLVGMPTVSLIGSIAAALTVGSRRAGALISVLVLPLCVPVIIFALSASQAWVWGETLRPHLLLLGACFVAALALAPLVAAASLRLALD